MAVRDDKYILLINSIIAGGGAVTSVGLSAPAMFSVSGSPVTGSGTLSLALVNQSANLVFAGPGSGAAAAPTFRSLVAADIPSLSAVYQPLSANLTTYAGIAPSANVQTLLGAATFAAFKTSLTLDNVDNTSDATKNTAVATLTNKDLTSGTNTFPTFNQTTTGSAAKWTTARNLAGNSVDGSANVAFANKFIVQGTADAGLSAAQFLGALGTGIVKNTTTTGVLSIAVAADFPTLNQNTTGSAASLTTPRAINGTNFDGTAGITVTASAGTLTGATLNSTVTASSLTSFGAAIALGTPASGNLANCTFPTLNQSTTGSAATLTTPRAIYGNNFDGSAALTGIIASTYGGTGNGFTKFSGPTTAEKTKTLRDANDTILELGGSYTPTGTWTSLTMVTPVLGTPTSGVLTNCTGTAAGLTAGNVTTNANLTGDVTSVGNATTIAAAAVTLAKMANMATGSLIYRKTAAAGVPEVNTLATLKTDLGLTGTNSGDQTITLTGGVTGTGTGSFAATVITNANLTGDVTSVGNASTVVKINGVSLAGLATGILKNTTTTGVPSIAVAADFPTLNQSTTGNAATVTTNANLTGDVTSAGNATTLTNAPVIAKVLTGYVSGAGTVAATDSILQAIQKLNGNDATNANLTGQVTSVGNATTITAQNSAFWLGKVTDATGTGLSVFNNTPTLLTPIFTGLPTGTGVASAATASTLAARDVNANLLANNLLEGYAIQSVGAGTIALYVYSAYLQFFTGGGLSQIVTLPVASILAVGHQFQLVNNSSLAVTATSSGGNAVIILAPGTSAIVTCILASGTTAASWSASYSGVVTTSGKVGTFQNTIALTGTDSTTMTFPSTSATIARVDAAQTFTGVQTFSSTIAGSVNGNAATVTTNANLTGEATSSGSNAVTLTNSAIIGKVLTGYTSGAGTVAATDSILQAIQKLNGNDATNANLTGDVTSVGNATTLATVTVAKGGTGTTTAFTAGSAVFAGASGVYSQDNANYFWDNTNKRLGVGTNAPLGTLEIFNTSQTLGHDIVLSRYSSSITATRASAMFHYYSGGGANQGDLLAFGVSGDWSGVTANYNVPNQLSLAKMVITAGGNVGIGNTSPTASTALDVTSTTGAFLPPRMTTTQRDALTAIDGMMIYNSTTGALNYRKAGAWVAI